MQTIKSPFLQVQAIRAELRARGIPTLAKPYYGYEFVINLADGNPGTSAFDQVLIDKDSYFIWISTTLGSWPDPYTRNVGVGPQDPADQWWKKEIRLELAKTGRRMHSGEFMGALAFDWESSAGTPFPFDSADSSQGELMGFGDVGQPSTSLFGIRSFMPEPILLEPSEQVILTVRNRTDLGGAVDAAIGLGHVFTMCGVKLFPGRA